MGRQHGSVPTTIRCSSSGDSSGIHPCLVPWGGDRSEPGSALWSRIMRIALVFIAIVLTTIALGGITIVARQYDIAAAGALITAWATIVGALITVLVAVSTAAQQREHALRSEEAATQRQLRIENQRAQDEALQEYVDHMEQL